MTDSSRVQDSRRRRALLTGGIVFLAVFMPLAFGAVHPWAYKIGEASAFALLCCGRSGARRATGSRRN